MAAKAFSMYVEFVKLAAVGGAIGGGINGLHTGWKETQAGKATTAARTMVTGAAGSSVIGAIVTTSMVTWGPPALVLGAVKARINRASGNVNEDKSERVSFTWETKW